MLERAQSLAALCTEWGTTLPAAAIAFVQRDPAITNVTLGMRTPEQVASNLAHVSAELPEGFWGAAVERGLITVDPAMLR